jgi:hypothetical protein
MDFETRLKRSLAVQDETIDEERFLLRLESRRREAAERKERLISGVSAVLLLLFVGYGVISQLDPGGLDDWYTDISETQWVDPAVEAQFIDDLAYYLVEESEDIWSTLEFLETVEYEPIMTILEEKL